jgi:hypothetical protein
MQQVITGRKSNMSKSIELKVSFHPSGRRTLMQKASESSVFHDCPGQLMGNLNEAEFYRSVARHIGKLSVEGYRVEYRDTSE